jgi:hypothetical protein
LRLHLCCSPWKWNTMIQDPLCPSVLPNPNLILS